MQSRIVAIQFSELVQLICTTLITIKSCVLRVLTSNKIPIFNQFLSNLKVYLFAFNLLACSVYFDRKFTQQMQYNFGGVTQPCLNTFVHFLMKAKDYW